MAKRMSMRTSLTSSSGRKSEMQAKLWKAGGPVESTHLSQKIKVIFEKLRFKVSMVYNG